MNLSNLISFSHLSIGYHPGPSSLIFEPNTFNDCPFIKHYKLFQAQETGIPFDRPSAPQHSQGQVHPSLLPVLQLGLELMGKMGFLTGEAQVFQANGFSALAISPHVLTLDVSEG